MRAPKGCKIAQMLCAQKRRHVSFHTPGHKRAGADITELSYSDNLYSPEGVLREAERDVAGILGAARSFLLTDGSTCGVFAMLAAAKRAGCTRIAAPVFSHISVRHACEALGLTLVEIPCARREQIPCQPTVAAIEAAMKCADALLLTSPDYYGFLAPLVSAREICTRQQKPLLIDGAHGSHLHFSVKHAGKYADLWVDGVHKSLPALTQGAVVSAKAGEWANLLAESVKLFRTTSPSYPILASVEYAVKYPRNLKLEQIARSLKPALGCVENDDWSKLVVPFWSRSHAAQAALEKHGVFPEFNDGNYLMFYLSPCTTERELKRLCRVLEKLPRGEAEEEEETRSVPFSEREWEWVPLKDAVGRVCARECGIFPPCTPLVCRGEPVAEREAARLLLAENTYGLQDGEIAVFAED